MVLSCRHMYLGQELRRIVWSTTKSAVVVSRLQFYTGCSDLMATPSELSALMHAYMSVHKRDSLKALVNSRYFIRIILFAEGVIIWSEPPSL